MSASIALPPAHVPGLSVPSPAAFVERFVSTELAVDPWFAELERDGAWDLIALTGSVSEGSADAHSDFDLFVVVPKAAQTAYRLRPVYEYEFHGVRVEVSLVATEKMANDGQNKENLFWWTNTEVVRCRDAKTLDLFYRAKLVGFAQIRDRVWSNYVLYQINKDNIGRLLARGDDLAIRMLVYDNVKFLSDTFLSQRNIFCHTKWAGTFIRRLYPRIASILTSALIEKDVSELVRISDSFCAEFVPVLESFGFSREEIMNWSSANLDKLTFQSK